MSRRSVLENDSRRDGTSPDLSRFASLSPDHDRCNIEQNVPNEIAVQEKRGLDLGLRGVLGDLAGSSPAIQQISSLIRQVAATSAPVLICGESGTGKELVARKIHQCSLRGDGPFVRDQCSRFTRDSGRERVIRPRERRVYGSHGAVSGCFEQAHGGTLFLDEIGEMPQSTQPKLLRVLEDLRVRRLGGKHEIPVDARVLAATSQGHRSHLREELYYRLSVFQIVVPPLREHKEDIGAIAEVLLQNLNRKHGTSITGVDAEVLDFFIGMIGPAMCGNCAISSNEPQSWQQRV